jgi:hypothetical protein
VSQQSKRSQSIEVGLKSRWFVGFIQNLIVKKLGTQTDNSLLEILKMCARHLAAVLDNPPSRLVVFPPNDGRECRPPDGNATTSRVNGFRGFFYSVLEVRSQPQGRRL